MGRKFRLAIYRLVSNVGYNTPAARTYASKVLLVELRSDHRSFEIVLDIGFAREAAEGRRQRLLDMAGGVAGHFHLETGDVQVGEHAVMRAAGIVEGKLHGSAGCHRYR